MILVQTTTLIRIINEPDVDGTEGWHTDFSEGWH